jgi:hypothetical protein
MSNFELIPIEYAHIEFNLPSDACEAAASEAHSRDVPERPLACDAFSPLVSSGFLAQRF